MSRESQNVEWKASWRDEYLRWVCGFANIHPLQSIGGQRLLPGWRNRGLGPGYQTDFRSLPGSRCERSSDSLPVTRHVAGISL